MSARCPYEVLEVEPGAPFSEIRRAYERIRAIFGPNSLAVYSLVSPEQHRAVLLEIEDAYRILSDPELRASHDDVHGHAPPPADEVDETPGLRPGPPLSPEGDDPPRARAKAAARTGADDPVPSFAARDAASAPTMRAVAQVQPGEIPGTGAEGQERSASAGPTTDTEPSAPTVDRAADAAESTPLVAEEAAPPRIRPTPPPLPPHVVARPAEPPTAPLPPISEDTVFTGELLRQVRLARGMTIRQIADRTKISPTHIESIELERWDWLPARVFLRGFLVSLARELRLDPEQVSRTFLSRRERTG